MGPIEPTRGRVEEIFYRALELTGEARSQFLSSECGNDVILQRKVEALLTAHSSAEGFLEKTVHSSQIASMLEPEEGHDAKDAPMLDRYRLVSRIGRGGCGVVYMAEQAEPLRREVAIKVIKTGMDTSEVIARFEAERQALAMMDHPNIAKVFDAGSTKAGRPYFVMELVRGNPVTKYCNEKNLPTAARLALFVKVCQAVQHAHQKGIIHRDIKPSNILVASHDGVAVPKVIDFGISKAIGKKIDEQTVLTSLGQLVGTPAYMSPEQATFQAVDIDTRSDIYSLGVLLYELLTGRTPFDAADLINSGFDEMCRHIRLVDPPTPSSCLSKLPTEQLKTEARGRQVAPQKLIGEIRGDLDWIVMRCLEKDRTRRYATANALALDIQRHVEHRPISARPPSPAYRFRKFVRRNRLVVAAATTVVIALVFGVIVSTWQAIVATRAVGEQNRLRELAQQAGEREGSLRRAAEAQELKSRQRAYAADMNLVQQALSLGNLGWARQLLYGQKPTSGQQDLRGWEWRYLWQECQGDARTILQSGNSKSVFSLALSSDGKWVAVGRHAGGSLSILNLQTNEEISLSVGNDAVRAVFSPREPLLAIGTRDMNAIAGQPRYRVILWDMVARRQVRELILKGRCNGLSFAADGDRIAVREAGPWIGVTIWRVADGAKLDECKTAGGVSGEDSYNIYDAFATSSNLSLAAFKVAMNQVRIVDLISNRTLRTITASADSISALAFSPNGKILASGAAYVDSVIRLWDIATGAELYQLTGHRRWIGQLIFQDDGRQLVSCSADQTICFWDVDSGTVKRTFRGHDTEVWRVASAPDRGVLISGGKDGSVVRWDLGREQNASAPIMMAGKLSWRDWCITPEADAIVTVDDTGQVVRRTYGIKTVNEEPLFGIGANSIAVFCASRPFLASISDDKLMVWDWKQRALVRQFLIAPQRGRRLQFSSDGATVALTAFSSQIVSHHEWNIETGDAIRSHEISMGNATPSTTRIAVSPDNRQAVSIPFPEGESLQFDFQSGRPRVRQLNVIEPGQRPTFSHDGGLLIVPSYRSETKVFDTASYRLVGTLGGPMLSVHSAAFASDGHRLATGGTGSEALTLWDPQSLQPVLMLRASAGAILQIAFSRDGNVLAAQNRSDGMNHRSIFIWRAPSWSEIDAVEQKQGKPAGGS